MLRKSPCNCIHKNLIAGNCPWCSRPILKGHLANPYFIDLIENNPLAIVSFWKEGVKYIVELLEETITDHQDNEFKLAYLAEGINAMGKGLKTFGSCQGYYFFEYIFSLIQSQMLDFIENKKTTRINYKEFCWLVKKVIASILPKKPSNGNFGGFILIENSSGIIPKFSANYSLLLSEIIEEAYKQGAEDCKIENVNEEIRIIFKINEKWFAPNIFSRVFIKRFRKLLENDLFALGKQL